MRPVDAARTRGKTKEAMGREAMGWQAANRRRAGSEVLLLIGHVKSPLRTALDFEWASEMSVGYG